MESAHANPCRCIHHDCGTLPKLPSPPIKCPLRLALKTALQCNVNRCGRCDTSTLAYEATLYHFMLSSTMEWSDNLHLMPNDHRGRELLSTIGRMTQLRFAALPL